MFARLQRNRELVFGYPPDFEYVPTTAFNPPVAAVSDTCKQPGCDHVPSDVIREGRTFVAYCRVHTPRRVIHRQGGKWKRGRA